MQAHLHYTESGTGEVTSWDCELAELTPLAVAEAIRRDEQGAEWIPTDCTGSLIANGRTLAFCFRTTLHYFGDTVFAGVAYT